MAAIGDRWPTSARLRGMFVGTVPNVRFGDVIGFAEHALDRRSVGQERLVTDHLVCWYTRITL
jgi:hypothetical protein